MPSLDTKDNEPTTYAFGLAASPTTNWPSSPDPNFSEQLSNSLISTATNTLPSSFAPEPFSLFSERSWSYSDSYIEQDFRQNADHATISSPATSILTRSSHQSSSVIPGVLLPSSNASLQASFQIQEAGEEPESPRDMTDGLFYHLNPSTSETTTTSIISPLSTAKPTWGHSRASRQSTSTSTKGSRQSTHTKTQQQNRQIPTSSSRKTPLPPQPQPYPTTSSKKPTAIDSISTSPNS